MGTPEEQVVECDGVTDSLDGTDSAVDLGDLEYAEVDAIVAASDNESVHNVAVSGEIE